MNVTVDGISIVASSFKKKASFPMVCRPSENWIDVNPQLLKADSPIDVTLPGMEMELKPLQEKRHSCQWM